MFSGVIAGDGNRDVGSGFCIQNNGECGGVAGFCSEQVGAISGAGLGDGDAVGVIVGVFERRCVGLSPCIVARVIGSCGEGRGDITIVEVIIDTGDGDGLGGIPVGCCKGERCSAERALCGVVAG